MNDDLPHIDRELVRLLGIRAESCIRRAKESGISPGTVFDLRDSLLPHLNDLDRGPLPDDLVRKIFNDIVMFSLDSARPLRIAFLGPPGTFTGIAAEEIFSAAVEKIPAKTIPDVFSMVESEAADYGVVPVENSTEGMVTFTMDELIETPLHIVAEKFIRISYCLVSKQDDMSGIRRLYSHPQPLGQCKEWLRKNLPDAEVITVDSTSRAAEMAAEDPDSSAISSHAAAERCGLNILARHLEDLRENYTRFFAMGRGFNRPTGNDMTSIVCAIKDKPGALHDLIIPLKNAGISMAKIESRPNKKKMWEYNFFIDFHGHTDDKVVTDTLDIMRNETYFLKILGSYPAGK